MISCSIRLEHFIIKFQRTFLRVPRGPVVKLWPGASKVPPSATQGMTFFFPLLFFFFFSFPFQFRYNSFVMFLYIAFLTMFRFTNFLLGFTKSFPRSCDLRISICTSRRVILRTSSREIFHCIILLTCIYYTLRASYLVLVLQNQTEL